MPTALCRVYTDQGFVIAADGRLYEADLGKPINESMKKVFPIERTGFSAALSYTGRLGITHKKSGLLVLDYAKEALALTEGLNADDYGDLGLYAKTLAGELSQAIRTYTRNEPLVFRENQEGTRSAEPGGGFAIGCLYLDGFYRNAPMQAMLELFHLKQEFRISVRLRNPPSFDIECSGAPTIITRLFNNDPALAAYHVQKKPRYAVTEAVGIVRRIIAAQMSDPARVMAEEECRMIGGRIHIAIVARGEGFRWVPGHEPI